MVFLTRPIFPYTMYVDNLLKSILHLLLRVSEHAGS